MFHPVLIIGDFRLITAHGGWHMDGWGWGMGLVGFLAMLLIVAVVIWVVVTTTQGTGPGRTTRRRSAIDLLDERYARGEIDRSDYLERRGDLDQA